MFVVDVDKGALDVRETLQLALQALAHVVRDFERGVLVHDDVDLDVVLLSGVIGSALTTHGFPISILFLSREQD